MKRVIVCGAGGFIGSHLVSRLREEGCYVIGLSRSQPHYYHKMSASEFHTCDLRESQGQFFSDKIDAVYQLACEVGGLGYIMDHGNDATMLRNSTLIDLNVLEACRKYKIPKLFFASSACVYYGGTGIYKEADAYPANPMNEFGWQKIFAERMYQAYANNYGIDIRIARLFNTYGPGMPWTGGREKVIGALCRKVAELPASGGKLEVWGNGAQMRSFLYVDDAVEGISRLASSNCREPVNIGPAGFWTLGGLVRALDEISGKTLISSFNPDKPTGNPSICCDTALLVKTLQWSPQTPRERGLGITYEWVQKQVAANRKTV